MGLSSMDNGGIRAPLFLTILVMAVVPLCAAFYLLDRAVATSLDLGFNGSVMRALEDSARNLKTLKRLDPQQQEQYREQFEAVERLQRVYSDPGTLKSEVLDSLRIYFGLGLVAAVLLSMLLAMLLSRRIARLYEKTFDELIRHRQKVRYLEEMASWQDLARMLAHEIKNPLTPIEVLVTSLSKAYASKSGPEFRDLLDQAQTMIVEEIGYLKNTVNKFGEFARLPSAHLVKEDVSSVVAKMVKAVAASFDTADLRVSEQPAPLRARARIDVALFRQVLTNIVRNGVEANPDRRVGFDIQLLATEDSLVLSIANDGQLVPSDLVGRMFDPYVSGKSNKENMGLGLAIVKKIVIEHGGEITYRETDGRPTFVIVLPRVSP
ncbi:MAG: Multi-sensor signal transduction histidine kinase [Gammaproteobacteria bacterium]|nr:Multi-sensor signal transduction histidine kinase [Gammaproteobacteria bacterium]